MWFSGEVETFKQAKKQQHVPGATSKLLNSCHRNIEPGRDHTTFVDASNEFHHDFSCSMVINNLQIANVAMLLHHLQKLDDDLRVWPDENLTFSTLLSVHDVVQAISKHTDSHHLSLTVATDKIGLALEPLEPWPMSTHKIFDACDFLEKLKPSNKQKNNNMCQVPCASNNAKFKRNGFVQIQNCFFIFTLEEAILTDQMNHQFGPRKPSFHVFFWYQGTVDPNHGGIIQQMSFTLIGPISMRDLPDVIGSENRENFVGRRRSQKHSHCNVANWENSPCLLFTGWGLGNWSLIRNIIFTTLFKAMLGCLAITFKIL